MTTFLFFSTSGSSSSTQPTDQPSSSGLSTRGSSQLDFDQILNDICRQDDRNSRGDGRKVTGERKHKHGSPAGKGRKGKSSSKRNEKQMNPWELNQPASSMNLSTEMETEFDRIKREISSKDERQQLQGSIAGASGSNGNGVGKSGDGLKKPRSISDVGKPSLLISGPQSSSWSPSRSLGTGKKNSSGKNYPSVRLQRVPSPNLNSQGRPHGNRSPNDPFSVLLDSSSNHLQVQPATVLSASAEDMHHQPRLKPGRSLQRSASDRATTSSSKSLVAGLLPPRKSSLTGGERREISFSFVMTSKRTLPSPKLAKSHASTESPWEFQADVAKKMAAEAAAAQNSDQSKEEASGLISHRRSSLEKASDSLISVPKFSTPPVHSKRSKSESPAREGGRKSKSKSRQSAGDKSAAAVAAAELHILRALNMPGNSELYDSDVSKGHIHPRKLEKTAPLAQPESSGDNHHSGSACELKLSSTLSMSKAKSQEEQRPNSAGGEPSGLLAGAEGGIAVEELLRIDQEEEDKEGGVWQMYL